jgi:hypothetical protein
MLTLANMVHFLAHKFAGLRAGGFSFTRIPARALNRFSFRHGTSYFLTAARVGVRPFP